MCRCVVSRDYREKSSFMIGGYAKAGDYMSCYSTFKEYMRSGIRPDTLPLVIKVCRDTKDLVEGRLMHNVVYKLGFSPCYFVAAVLVDMVIVVRDANRFHHFKGGACSCRDYW
ncbi:hypothetical protein BUALT_Bualt11G0097900 [Buddleja alternifolia]|uniref:DYW domain-containing protein n=1 Tax=Buddleja alternifolia TaxID=168488 RepID=A0AAV6WYM0_9LAMI|nr:hypothetical protein BUALT_Bualt11G0097900 [Buddleja alternifolia]